MRLGVKAHWKDASAMAAIARRHAARVLEVHLAPHDLERDRERVLSTFAPLRSEFDLVVHQPYRVSSAGRPSAEFFLNPAAAQEPWRLESERALLAAAKLAKELDAIGLVVHPGGIAFEGILASGGERALARTLSAIRGEVPIWLENMPWFYNDMGERQGRATIGRTGESLLKLADHVDGYCLDVCHAHLAEPHASRLVEISEALGERVRHIHASGAARLAAEPERGEGLPLTEGDLAIEEIFAAAKRAHASAALVPEIRDGHAAGGVGFDEALARLVGARR